MTSRASCEVELPSVAVTACGTSMSDVSDVDEDVETEDSESDDDV